MSNRQLPWDNDRIRYGESLRDTTLDEQDKENLEQQQAQRQPENDKDRVLDSNPGTHSKKD